MLERASEEAIELVDALQIDMTCAVQLGVNILNAFCARHTPFTRPLCCSVCLFIWQPKEVNAPAWAMYRWFFDTINPSFQFWWKE